jgi:hypothetical protein
LIIERVSTSLDENNDVLWHGIDPRVLIDLGRTIEWPSPSCASDVADQHDAAHVVGPLDRVDARGSSALRQGQQVVRLRSIRLGLDEVLDGSQWPRIDLHLPDDDGGDIPVRTDDKELVTVADRCDAFLLGDVEGLPLRVIEPPTRKIRPALRVTHRISIDFAAKNFTISPAKY